MFASFPPFLCSKRINSVLFPCLFLILGFTAAHKWGTCLGTCLDPRSVSWATARSPPHLPPAEPRASPHRWRCMRGWRNWIENWKRSLGKNLWWCVFWCFLGWFSQYETRKKKNIHRDLGPWEPRIFKSSKSSPKLQALSGMKHLSRTHGPTRIHQKWHTRWCPLDS